MRESGRIPGSFAISWEQRKVGELIKDGIIDAPLDGNHGEKHPTASEYVDSGIPFLMASDVHGGIADIKSCKFITRERAERLDKGFAKNGDVLLTHKATIGESAILQGLETEYAVLTPQVTYYRIQDEKKLSREYLYAFFNSVKFQNDLKTKAAQSTRPYIGISAQQNLDIVLPRKLTEQKKIGVYFSDLDHLITLHQRKLCVLCILERLLYENIKQFEVTVSWEQRKVSDLSEKTFGGGTPKTSNDSFWKGNIPWIQSSDLVEGSLFDVEPRKYISQEAVDKSATKLVPEKSVAIVTRVGVGKLAFMPFSYATSQDFLSLSVLKTEPQFTVYALYKKLQSELNAVQGTSIKGVTKDELLAKEVMIPCYKEQDKIGSYLHFLDHLITLHQRKP